MSSIGSTCKSKYRASSHLKRHLYHLMMSHRLIHRNFRFIHYLYPFLHNPFHAKLKSPKISTYSIHHGKSGYPNRHQHRSTTSIFLWALHCSKSFLLWSSAPWSIPANPPRRPWPHRSPTKRQIWREYHSSFASWSIPSRGGVHCMLPSNCN